MTEGMSISLAINMIVKTLNPTNCNLNLRIKQFHRKRGVQRYQNHFYGRSNLSYCRMVGKNFLLKMLFDGSILL